MRMGESMSNETIENKEVIIDSEMTLDKMGTRPYIDRLGLNRKSQSRISGRKNTIFPAPRGRLTAFRKAIYIKEPDRYRIPLIIREAVKWGRALI